MINLLSAELLARELLEQQTEKTASVGNVVRGAGRITQETASALGKGLEREIGGVTGKGLRVATEAAPTFGAFSLGGYGLDALLGHPGTRWLAHKKEQVKQKLQGQPKFQYDPQTGAWY